MPFSNYFTFQFDINKAKTACFSLISDLLSVNSSQYHNFIQYFIRLPSTFVLHLYCILYYQIT